MGERKALVAICHNWPVLFSKTAQSLMEIGWGDRVPTAKAKHGFSEISFAWYANAPRVDDLRNAACEDARAGGFTHLIFLDADMVWPTDVLDRLLAHHDRHGVTSGLYVLKAPPYAPVALRDGQQADGSAVVQYFHDLDATGGAVRDEDVVGMGCAIFPVSMLDDMGPRPWFRYQADDDGWNRVSEDVPFCQSAKAAGYGVWVDPTIACGHLGVQAYDVRWSKRYQLAVAETLRRQEA